MSKPGQRLDLEVSLAIRNFMEQRKDRPTEFHTVEHHAVICAGRLTDDRSDCNCHPDIVVHLGRAGDCLSCQMIGHARH